MSIANNYREGKYSQNTHLTHARFRGGASIEDNLGDSDYVATLPKYIAKRYALKYLDKSFARREGLKYVGTKSDKGNVFGTQRGRLFHSASAKSQHKAGELLHQNAVRELLTTKFKTRSGAEINVKFVKKNIYIREIKSKSGIQYTQARNAKTGRVMSIKKLLKISK